MITDLFFHRRYHPQGLAAWTAPMLLSGKDWNSSNFINHPMGNSSCFCLLTRLGFGDPGDQLPEKSGVLL